MKGLVDRVTFVFKIGSTTTVTRMLNFVEIKNLPPKNRTVSAKAAVDSGGGQGGRSMGCQLI